MSWINDGMRDCKNGEDEIKDKWNVCENMIENTTSVISSTEVCKNVFRCSRLKTTLTVMLDVLCDGIESCRYNGNENKVCQIARDFPIIDRNVPVTSQHNLTFDLCINRKEKCQI